MSTSETVQAAQRLLAERERVGLAKYGTTVDRTDLQAGDWLQHAIEEASDLLLYLIRLRDTIPRVTFHPRPGPLDSDPAEAERNMLAKEDADRAAHLARWANAPAEATHLAQDPDAECLWFSGAPKQDSHDYWQGHFLGRAGDKILGRVACEPRPTPAVDPERAGGLDLWRNLPVWARYLSQDADGQCKAWERKPNLIAGVWIRLNDEACGGLLITCASR
jgi:hypothetical protein